MVSICWPVYKCAYLQRYWMTVEVRTKYNIIDKTIRMEFPFPDDSKEMILTQNGTVAEVMKNKWLTRLNFFFTSLKSKVIVFKIDRNGKKSVRYDFFLLFSFTHNISNMFVWEIIQFSGVFVLKNKSNSNNGVEIK